MFYGSKRPTESREIITRNGGNTICSGMPVNSNITCSVEEELEEVDAAGYEGMI